MRTRNYASLFRPFIGTILSLLAVLGLLGISNPLVANASPLVVSTTCEIAVPTSPLSSQGLASAWKLQPPCHEGNAVQGVFVQGVVFDPATKTISDYNPLVVNADGGAAVKPVAPVLPAGAVVAIFGGGNDTKTHLVGPGAGACVNGADGRVFGQVFFCGASAFFAAVHASGMAIPAIGVDSHGNPCPTTRSFKIVDQDQSDNVQTSYLALQNGKTAQNTAANRALFPNATVIHNPSDNLVLSNFIDPAIGCSAWMVPNLADNGALVPTQATDELQAAAYQANPALIPSGDPMVGPNILGMVNAYRINVDQPTVGSLAQASTHTYCVNLRNIQTPWLASYKTVFQNTAGPVAGQNLYAFLKARLAASFVNLKCGFGAGQH